MEPQNFRKYKFEIFICFILMVKIIAMAVFSSDYQERLFMPFIDDFTGNVRFGFNPYDFYYEKGINNAFPYPPLMLLIESAGGVLIRMFGIQAYALKNILFKLPGLCFDCLGLYYILKLFPDKRKYVGILYFASPVILYGSYMHGQLDLIPTVLLVISVYYLFGRRKKDWVIAAVILSAALLTKLHIIAVVPVILLYLYKRDGLQRAFLFMVCITMVSGLVILPFFGGGFVRLVLLNEEQSILSRIYFDYAYVRMYLPVLAVVLIYLVVHSVNVINKELLLSFCGILFAIFLALCPPMPGWYIWIIPFMTIFFINMKINKYNNLFIYVVFNSLYLIYFIFFHNRQMVDLYYMGKSLAFLKVENETVCNLVFTALSGVLMYIIYSIYKTGIYSNSLYRKNIPFVIGISGDSGAGKSTMLGILEHIFYKRDILYIEGDGDHRWERGDEEWQEYTHLDPRANYLYRQAHDIQQLRSGNAVTRVDYDHKSGRFTSPYSLYPRRFIILCGLHSLYLPQMRKNMDLKIYMDTDETLRRYWKIHRDMDKRDYTAPAILEQIESRVQDAKKYIWPQKEYADLIVTYYDDELTDCCQENYEVTLSAKLMFGAFLDAEPLINRLTDLGVRASFNYNDDLRTQTVLIDGRSLRMERLDFDALANEMLPQIDEITRKIISPDDNLTGIIILFLLELINNKMREEV